MQKTSSAMIRNMVLTAVFAALIIVMTVTPFLGYISYGAIEITTLHIVTILAAVSLGPVGGTIVGAVWGMSCIARAYLAFPIFLDFGFGNFFVAGLPRILVGTFAGLCFWGLCKTKLPKVVSAGISAVVGTLTNTVLVLSSMNVWQKMHNVIDTTSIKIVFGSIFKTLIGINGVIELVAAVILVPALFKVIDKIQKRV